jgi:hypothetical protein
MSIGWNEETSEGLAVDPGVTGPGVSTPPNDVPAAMAGRLADAEKLAAPPPSAHEPATAAADTTAMAARIATPPTYHRRRDGRDAITYRL